MNEQLIKIGLESGMLNYVDNETPRHYFLSGHADEQDLEKFAELILEECRTVINDVYHKTPLELCGPLLTVDEEIMNHFYGVEKLT